MARNYNPKSLDNLTKGLNSFKDKELASKAGLKGHIAKKEKRDTLQWLNYLAQNNHLFNGEQMQGSEIAAMQLLELVKSGELPAIREWFDRLHGAAKLSVDQTLKGSIDANVNIKVLKDELLDEIKKARDAKNRKL
jgi:hypothetical protein